MHDDMKKQKTLHIHLVALWNDGGCDVVSSNRAITPDGIEPNRLIKAQKGNELWEGVIDSIWSKFNT